MGAVDPVVALNQTSVLQYSFLRVSQAVNQSATVAYGIDSDCVARDFNCAVLVPKLQARTALCAVERCELCCAGCALALGGASALWGGVHLSQLRALERPVHLLTGLLPPLRRLGRSFEGFLKSLQPPRKLLNRPAQPKFIARPRRRHPRLLCLPARDEPLACVAAA